MLGGRHFKRQRRSAADELQPECGCMFTAMVTTDESTLTGDKFCIIAHLCAANGSPDPVMTDKEE